MFETWQNFVSVSPVLKTKTTMEDLLEEEGRRQGKMTVVEEEGMRLGEGDQDQEEVTLTLHKEAFFYDCKIQ